MKKTARVIVTFKCNRSCPGCCNTDLPPYRTIHRPEDLLNYEEIVITGGEPLLIDICVYQLLRDLKEAEYNGRIYMYTAMWGALHSYAVILNDLDGITFTLHAECTDMDIYALNRLSKELQSRWINSRLFIDTRVYERYDLSNIDLTGWSVIRKLQWQEHCDPAPNEDLIYFDLEEYYGQK